MGKKIRKVLLNWDLVIADAMLGFLVLVTFSGVIFRYVLNQPIEWLEEVQMMAIVWVVFLGSGAAFREQGHVAVEIIVELFPEKMQTMIRILTGLLIMAVLLTLAVLSAKYVGVSYVSGRRSGILRIPYYQVYAIIPVSCVWMVLCYLYGELHQGKDGKEDEV